MINWLRNWWHGGPPRPTDLAIGYEDGHRLYTYTWTYPDGAQFLSIRKVRIEK